MDKIHKLHASIISTGGYVRACLYDLHREKYNLIPIELHQSISQNSISVSEENELNSEYFDFLVENEFIFEIAENEKSLFPSLNFEWYYPALISNLVINLNGLNLEVVTASLSLLEQMGTKHIQLISIDPIPVKFLEQILSQLCDSRVQSIEIIIKYSDEDFKKLLLKYRRIKFVVLHSASIDLVYNENEKNEEHGFYAELKKKIYSFEERSSNVHYEAFFSNIPLFTESQKHHTYFNRKLYIGIDGIIKNAPECNEAFGNIKDIKDAEDLKAIIVQPAFQKYWFVHKELCDVCKDCEFRHMCVDNRIPYQRKDGSWYHKTECNYNPYICKWKDEEGYKTLKECGAEVTEKEYKRNDEKIAKINMQLWED